MPKWITIATLSEFRGTGSREHQAKEVIEHSDYQIIWLLASGRRTEDVAEITGYRRSLIYELGWQRLQN